MGREGGGGTGEDRRGDTAEGVTCGDRGWDGMGAVGMRREKGIGEREREREGRWRGRTRAGGGDISEGSDSGGEGEGGDEVIRLKREVVEMGTLWYRKEQVEGTEMMMVIMEGRRGMWMGQKSSWRPGR